MSTSKVLKLSVERSKCLSAMQRGRVIQESIGNGLVRCISCGKILRIEDADGGHFFGKGAWPRLACCPENIHPQCHWCNRMADGNQIGYRRGLIARYGEDYEQRLEDIADASKGSEEAILRLCDEDIRRYASHKWTAQEYHDEAVKWERVVRDYNRRK